MTIDELRQKIEADCYQTSLPFRTKDEKEAFRNAQARANAEFKRDLLAALGLSKHPKADLFYSKCWEQGHAHGYHEVMLVAQDWAELLEI